MLTNECWLGMHDYCHADDVCDCLCHVTYDPLFDDLESELEDGE